MFKFKLIFICFSLVIFFHGSVLVFGSEIQDPQQINGDDDVNFRFKREPQRNNNNQRHQQQQNRQFQFQNQQGLRRSFSTGNLDQIDRRRRPGGSHNNNGGQSCNLNYDFDYFVLAIQWPSSFCLEKQECDLKIATKRKWLIHGLWPNKHRGHSLGRNNRDTNLSANRQLSNSDPNLLAHDNAEFCCGPRYNSSLVNGRIYQELLEKWPTLHPGGRHHSFWQHEWQKHGTCARQVRPLQNQVKYFETILGLYNLFDLSTVDFQHGKPYKIEDIHRKIEPRVGNFKVRLECSLVDANLVDAATIGSGKNQKQQQANSHRESNNNNGGQTFANKPKKSIFSEVHICLDKALRPINCPHRDDYQCKRSVLFP